SEPVTGRGGGPGRAHREAGDDGAAGVRFPVGDRSGAAGPVTAAPAGGTMGQVGFVLSHEQFPAPRLVELAVAAEEAGFDRLWTSDHFHPWMDNQGHAGQAWVTLAAVSQRVGIPFGTGVTCPTFRYRPAV